MLVITPCEVRGPASGTNDPVAPHICANSLAVRAAGIGEVNDRPGGIMIWLTVIEVSAGVVALVALLSAVIATGNGKQ